MIEFLVEHGEDFRHRLRQVLEVLKTLHHGYLGAKCMAMGLDGKTDDFIHAQFDLGDLHVGFALRYPPCGTGEAAGL